MVIKLIRPLKIDANNWTSPSFDIFTCDSYEIIEEDKKIVKLIDLEFEGKHITVVSHVIVRKINELIDAVNKLKAVDK